MSFVHLILFSYMDGMNTRIILQVGSGSPNYLANALDKWVSASASFDKANNRNNRKHVTQNTFGKVL